MAPAMSTPVVFPARMAEVPGRTILVKRTDSQAQRIVARVLRQSVFAFGRGFSAGFALRFLLSAIPHLIKGRFKQVGKTAAKPDVWRFGLFLGTFSGSFQLLRGVLRTIRGKDDVYNVAIAAFIASFALAIDKQKARREEVALYIASRTLERVYREYSKGPLKAIDFYHGDVLLFCLCCSVIMWAFIGEPESMRPSYYQFFQKLLGRTPVGLRFLNKFFPSESRSKLNKE